MSNILYFPSKARALPLKLPLDQAIVLAAKRPGNPAKKLGLATLALVRLHAGCAEIAQSTLDLGNQQALAKAVMKVLEEYLAGVEKL